MMMNSESINKSRAEISGAVLIATLMFQTLLVAIMASSVYLTRIETREVGIQQDEMRTLWLAEAGLQKAVWNVKTPTGSGGQGEDWTTTGTTESLGDGSYTMVVERWDFALSANGSTATASSSSSGNGPGNAIDDVGNTSWESAGSPSSASPEFITIAFPYPLTINKVRFAAPSPAKRPKDYTYQVSSDGTNFTTVVTVTGNGAVSRTDTFVAQSNVTHVRLHVTATGTAGNPVSIRQWEAIGAKITSTGTISAGTGGVTVTRIIVQTVVADDGSPENQRAYYQTDWVEQ